MWLCVQKSAKNLANAAKEPKHLPIMCSLSLSNVLAMINAVQILAFAQSNRITRLWAPQAQCEGLQARLACLRIRPCLISFNRVNISLHTWVQNVRGLAVVRSTVYYILATNAVGVAVVPIIYEIG